ncbi:MAG: ATP-binding protein [Bacteroidales bacterium]|nr:ATP-binding protein [Bacteroidales bacterium]MDD7575537.1 ATP-binding protein [Bacteroidales bacterium]MDY5789044.1 ATP-binding protein [Candidatus Onthomorpha sp.]
MSKDRIHIPKASTLMGSLRSMGYSFESAVADVIDNSISAHAKNIRILFPSTPLDELAIGILDDGDGMKGDVLFEAMRYGCLSAEEERVEDDLGRFGMGMKSASLSQCRCLTVVSFDGNTLNGFTWDYNHIIKTQDWIIQELEKYEIDKLPYIEKLKEQKKGTLVIWQDFDVIYNSSGGQVYSTLVDLRSSLENTLALIYHRFLSITGVQRLHMYINELDIKPLDPFLEQHPKTTIKKEIELDIKDSNAIERIIKIRPFILPYATELREKDKQLIGGIENLRAKQGFYIYRNKRLIIWGTWFGMKQRAELTKNTRIRVDIPNTLDDIWSIDIKKQQASIPKQILQRLKKAVDEALEFSIRQQTYRGRTEKVDERIDYIWDRKRGRNNTFFYQINRESKLFQFVRDKMSDEDYGYLEMLLTEIENNLPIQQLYIDKSNESISAPEETNGRLDDVYQMAVTLATTMMTIRSDGWEAIINDLMNSEPWCKYPAIKEQLLKEKIQ